MTALAPETVGWCPGALRPMESGDGLIVRLKPRGGVLGLGTAIDLASLAVRYGSGELELTGRANLQIRGVDTRSLGPLTEGLRHLDLLDANAEAEAVRNIVVSPLAGLDGRARADLRPLIAALERRLASDSRLWRLPAKWSIVVDDGGSFSLRAVRADISLEAISPESLAIGLDGGQHRAICTIDQGLEAIAALCELALRREPLRMQALVEAAGASAVFAAAGLAPAHALMPSRGRTVVADVLGWQSLAGGAALGLAAPFGKLEAADLISTLEAAQGAGATALHLTPWRAFLLTGFAQASDLPFRSPSSPADGSAADLIADGADPRLAVAACSGLPACRRASTAVRDDAATLARMLPSTSGRGDIVLHVSGCSKGCALPRAAPWTLIGHGGLYDLVRHGKADAVPVATGLTVQEVARRLSPALDLGQP